MKTKETILLEKLWENASSWYNFNKEDFPNEERRIEFLKSKEIGFGISLSQSHELE